MASKFIQVVLFATLFAVVFSSSTEDDVTYTGTFVKLMEDFFEEGVAKHTFGLKDVDNGQDFIELDPAEVLAASQDGRFPLNQVVTVRGRRSRLASGLLNRLRLTTLDVLRQKRVNGASPSTSGDMKILVILVQLANSTVGKTSTTCSSSQIATNFWTASTNINGMFQFASRGALSASQNAGTVIGPYTIQSRVTSGSQTVFDCDPYAWANAAKSAASSNGYNPNNYDVIHYSLPNYQNMNCGWGGLGEINGPNSWTAQCNSKSTSAHEIGHNIGFQHSSSLVNNAFAEYGDGTCVMGDDGSSGDLGTSYHILQRRKAGWLSFANAFVPVTNNGAVQTFQLLDYNANTNSLSATTPYAIQFAVPDGNFFFSYHVRQASGYDTGLLSSGTVTVHFYSGKNNDHPIRYGNFLSAGNSYYNATGRWRVNVTSTSSTSASVSVVYDAGAPCVSSVVSQGFENGLGSFTLSTSNSNIQPVLTTSRSSPTSPSTSVNMVEAPTTAATQSLTTPAVTIPTGTVTLSFAMKFWTDPGVQSNGVLYCTEAAIVSVVDGSTKTQLNTSVPYNNRVWTGMSNPLAGKFGWCTIYSNDVESSWQTVSVDVSAYAGKSVKFVWDFGTDNRAPPTYTPTGFFFDDIQINSQGACSSTPAASTTGVRQVAAATTGVRAAAASSTAVKTTGLQTTGVQTTDIKTTGAQSTGIQTTGRQSSGFLFGKRNIVAEKSKEEIEQQLLAKRAAVEAVAQPNSLVLPIAAVAALLATVAVLAVVIAKLVVHTRNRSSEIAVPISA